MWYTVAKRQQLVHLFGSLRKKLAKAQSLLYNLDLVKNLFFAASEAVLFLVGVNITCCTNQVKLTRLPTYLTQKILDNLIHVVVCIILWDTIQNEYQEHIGQTSKFVAPRRSGCFNLEWQ